MAMKLSAIVLIGIVLISIYIKSDSEPLVFRPTDDEIKPINQAFRLLSYDNKAVNLNELKVDGSKKLILLAFWASWCANCKEELKNLDLIQKKSTNLKFEIIAINLDPSKNSLIVDQLWASLNISIRLIKNPELKLIEPFDLEILPTYAIIKNNNYLYRIEGQANWSNPELQKLIQDYN